MNLYRDVGDLYGRNNSQREFYTMPSTTFPMPKLHSLNGVMKLPKLVKKIVSDVFHSDRPLLK